MKKILFVLCAAALLCSCTDDKAQKTAEGFLTGYLAMDYDTAVTFCDEAMAANLLKATEGWQALDTLLLARMKDAASKTRFEIASVDDETEKGTAHVRYLLYPMGSEHGHEMNMTLKKDGGKWLVSALR